MPNLTAGLAALRALEAKAPSYLQSSTQTTSAMQNYKHALFVAAPQMLKVIEATIRVIRPCARPLHLPPCGRCEDCVANAALAELATVLAKGGE